MRIGVCLLALAVAGCSTDRQVLELRRDRLLEIEQQALATKVGVEQGSFDPARYDLYLALDEDIFSRVLDSVKGTTVELEASGRPVALTIDALEMNFRPGSPEINLAVQAKDVRTGLLAKLAMDSRLIIEGDPAQPDQMTARIVATRIVPELRWGPLDFTKRKFVRALLSLEASRFTERLPALTLPLASDFAFGNPSSTVDSGRLPTGGNSWIRGNVSYPSTETKGRFAVRNILFLQNGVHLFADVEGI